jgi:ATP-dependent HslUV protease, peptidase subunit HslV
VQQLHATTIVGVRKDGQVAIGGDGQVTIGNTIMKAGASKVRTLADGRVIAGFAGAVSDALKLFERFESKLSEFSNNLVRAAVELGKEWRTDKYLRNLEALLAVCDKDTSLIVAGSGEVLEPDDGILAIGSGGPYALAAARALVKHSGLDSEAIVREALGITAGICIYTNNHITIAKL